MKSVEDNLKSIREEILLACRKSNRDEAEVQVIAVTKRQGHDVLNEALSVGLKDFAENYAQEAAEKQKVMAGRGINWHFIGSIQTNKLRNIVGAFELIHSVDRFKVASEMQKIAASQGLKQKALLQVNMAGEKSKSGTAPEDVLNFFRDTEGFDCIEWCGLMLMPPFANQPEQNRGLFRKGREMLLQIQAEVSWLNNDRFNQLSMGTSQDYAVAVEEGATMIRVGERLLGKRVV